MKEDMEEDMEDVAPLLNSLPFHLNIPLTAFPVVVLF